MTTPITRADLIELRVKFVDAAVKEAIDSILSSVRWSAREGRFKYIASKYIPEDVFDNQVLDRILEGLRAIFVDCKVTVIQDPREKYPPPIIIDWSSPV